jgi:hypothetical protein
MNRSYLGGGRGGICPVYTRSMNRVYLALYIHFATNIFGVYTPSKKVYTPSKRVYTPSKRAYVPFAIYPKYVTNIPPI